MGPPENICVLRNIFAARGTLRYGEAVNRLPDGTFTFDSMSNPPYVRYSGNIFLGNHQDRPKDDGAPVTSPALEQIERAVLDKEGRAKSGFEALDNICALMGWPVYREA